MKNELMQRGGSEGKKVVRREEWKRKVVIQRQRKQMEEADFPVYKEEKKLKLTETFTRWMKKCSWRRRKQLLEAKTKKEDKGAEEKENNMGGKSSERNGARGGAEGEEDKTNGEKSEIPKVGDKERGGKDDEARPRGRKRAFRNGRGERQRRRRARSGKRAGGAGRGGSRRLREHRGHGRRRGALLVTAKTAPWIIGNAC